MAVATATAIQTRNKQHKGGSLSRLTVNKMPDAPKRLQTKWHKAQGDIAAVIVRL